MSADLAMVAFSKQQPDEAITALVSVVELNCDHFGRIDSMGIDEYKRAIRVLAKAGLVDIQQDNGHNVIARWRRR